MLLVNVNGLKIGNTVLVKMRDGTYKAINDLGVIEKMTETKNNNNKGTCDIDERFEEPPDLTSKINTHMTKKKIYDALMSQKIGIQTKLKLIEQNYLLETSKSCNLHAGGLMDDW
jgi:hypothetical protein